MGTASWRWFFRAFIVLAVLVLVALAIWLHKALYHRWVTFPRQQAGWAELKAQRQPTQPHGSLTEFRGILHSHSHLSHDSEVPFEEILHVMKAIDLDFICLSDHCTDGRADFDAQWRGLHDGKLFIPGFEMRSGMMPFGVKPGVTLTNETELPKLAAQVVGNGGVLFFAHPEEPRNWELQELTGMELFNIHAAFKSINGFKTLLPELLVNQRCFPDQVFALLLNRPAANLERWDALNQTRHITGIAGNDCHQNSGLRMQVVEDDVLRFSDTGKHEVTRVKLNWASRSLAKMFFGDLTPGRQQVLFQLDPYERMAHLVNTHVLAPELSERAILGSLRAGRAFIGFDMIVDSTGFQWFAAGPQANCEMGESVPYSADMQLTGRSPVPCRFTVSKSGQQLLRQEGREIVYKPSGPGKYRVEAEVKVTGKWMPWVFTNPVDLQ